MTPSSPAVASPTPALLDWVASVAGPAAACTPHPASGRSRLIWLVHPATPGRPPMLLRSETGLGPFAGTEFTLGREAGVLRALAGSGVPVPAVHGVTEDGGSALLELLRGTADVDLDTAAGLDVLAGFCRHLAALHRLDPESVPLPRPVSARDHALLDLAAHRRSYRLCPPDDTADELLDLLIEQAPETASRTAVLHGDAGPGNFLHEHGRLTGLIDWEMAHVGDPMDDLAWLWFRITVLGGGGAEDRAGALAHAYRAYAIEAETSIDTGRIDYYCLLVLARCLVATLVRQRNNPANTPEPVERMTRLVRLALDNRRRTGRIGGGALSVLPEIG